MLTVDSAIQAFREAGVRITPQRMAIVNVLVGNRTHPTIDVIYANVRASFPSISLATVYHTMTLLAQHGLVLELRGAKDCIHCDPETTPHAHAYCNTCGAVFDLPLTALPTWDATTLNGFRPEKIDVSVYGFCHACAQTQLSESL